MSAPKKSLGQAWMDGSIVGMCVNVRARWLSQLPKSPSAKVVRRLPDIGPGAVTLSRKIEGYYNWNVSDLRRAR